MEGSGLNGGPVNGNSSSDFVRKLYKMLEDPSHDQVVRWGNDGDSFVVLENEKFTKTILPKHFKHSNFASFVRQLNKYDFHKVRHNNEENGLSPYGAGAWEFKHPDFKMNDKDSLDNIRRKAPAPRKAPSTADEIPTGAQQMDLVNSQLMGMQTQLQQLTDRYNELMMHHQMLLPELMAVQKSVVNHEQIMQSMMSYLYCADSFIRDQRRSGRMAGPFRGGADPSQQMAAGEDSPPSPLQAAEKLLHDSSTETLLHNKNLEHMNELYRQADISTTPPPEQGVPRNSQRQLANGAQPVPGMRQQALTFGRVASEAQESVYPVGHNNGIDPMYSEHINNIPYPMPSAGELAATDPRKQYGEGRKKSTAVDPGWFRSPQILLVEDDPTCRRIGGKFLYSFKCSIDSAFDGLEAVQKVTAGSKYDLVLMDIIMPNLDGVSACSLIRQFNSTPIIAMTSNIRSDDISMYFQHGMNDVLPKPFTKEGLLTMLEKHLGHLKASNKEGDEANQEQLHQGPTRSPNKEDSSAMKSPANSSWAPSPTQLVSPTTHTMNNDYMNALGGNAPFSINGNVSGPLASVQHDSNHMSFQAGPTSMSIARSGTTGHRRQISDVSSEDDMAGEAKRPRIYAPPMPNASIGSSAMGPTHIGQTNIGSSRMGPSNMSPAPQRCRPGTGV